ncbi:hypothetical protein LTR05_005960 [Lithohypha guttulata]|uniref:Queuosine 5'-phosphate N-glycosylase/hydrolase n=1 Tax=Lithohypha guttulata TaxID=1690604 RepID=A0AAN7Y5D2_9EURO|nr:hypothetical protein LTR05_005960 [Lithohypha guttulata]
MSDDEADPELLALLRQTRGLGPVSASAPPNTRVLETAEFVYDNAIDVSIVSGATKAAAASIWQLMRDKDISTNTWSEHGLHPKAKDESTVNFIFTMDLLNFSFWSTLSEDKRFQIDYKGRSWTGYWSLVAILQRALEEATDSQLRHVFRSSTDEEMPLLDDRINLLRESGAILEEEFDGLPINVIKQADHSAARFVNLLVDHFPGFRDEHVFHGKTVRFYKRAQIMVADLWAAFNGQDFGSFDDVQHITIFPDYRIPQILQSLNVLWYSPRLETKIKRGEEIRSGENMEIEVRGCSIWAVELLRREMVRQHPEAKERFNAVLIDFFLYDFCKQQEEQAKADGTKDDILPHHRTRSTWY